jgi:predicted  nucleic acid-binding Zn-ribbon protein
VSRIEEYEVMKDQLDKISDELDGASKKHKKQSKQLAGASKMHKRQAGKIRDLAKRAAKKAMEG